MTTQVSVWSLIAPTHHINPSTPIKHRGKGKVTTYPDQRGNTTKEK